MKTDIEEFNKRFKFEIPKDPRVCPPNYEERIKAQKIWLAACEYKNKEIEKLKEAIDIIKGLEKIKEVQSLEQKLKIATDALGFYAACENWGWESEDQQDEGYDYIKNDVEIDGPCGISSGKRARQALKEIGESDE